MSKRDYFLQKGLQMKRLDEQISAAPQAGGKEVTKYRELCPPGTPDTQIQTLIGQCKGDAQRMENAISELWEDYRGNDQVDDWATVSKKGTKKKQDQAPRSHSSHKTQHQDEHADAPQDGDAQPPRSTERFATRGHGSMRGRGMASSRGGRGGRGGRGRGGAVVATGSMRATRTGDNEDESPENDNNSTDGSSPSNEARVQQSSKVSKDSKRDRGAKTTTTTKTTTTQPAAQAPPVVYPVLTGAWTKKLNVAGVTSKPKPVEPVPTPAPAPTAPAAAPKPTEKPAKPAAEKETAAVPVATEAPKAASPKKKVQQEKKSSKKTQKSTTTEATEVAAAVVEKVETVKTVEKVASPKASPKKTAEKKKKTKTVETTVETTTSKIAAGWGNLDVSTSAMDEWSSSAPAAATEPKKVSTPNAWARGSPVLSPPASKEPTPAPKSPIADARPTVVPGSPKDIDAPRSTGSVSTSPRPYLKMGKWDTAATPNLSLQFGSFSLSGMDSLESTSPRGWASTTTTTTSASNNGGKTVTKTTTTQSAWGATTKAASPKKTLSPDRVEQQLAQEATATKATTSAPPGLSVESGRMTPTTGQSPRFTPSAPSPASLPKPDEVKRGTPTRAQGGPFQAQGGAAGQNNKMNIGYGSGLYQASYGQYSMDLGRPAAASTPGHLPAGSGTPKSAGARGGAAGQVAAQSPSRGQQPVAQMQQIPLQQQAQQQQQQQAQQQTQPKQVQQQQAQQPQQNQQTPAQQQAAAQMHQQAPAGMQQGYHYAPPPPPGMALPYNPYNYGAYYQGYGYYQNPQFAQYSPRTQYPPRGSMPYGVEGPAPGFSNPPNMPYQDQHMMAQQHEYAAGVPQGFGEINAGYLQQAPMQQGGHHGHHGHQSGPQGHGKGGAASGAGNAGSQQSHGQRGNAGMQGYQNAGGRDHVSPPVPNASAAMTGSYGQHYGWAGNYGAQPVGGWGHMMPQGYQQSPSQQQQVPPQQQQQQQQQQPNAHQQSYRQYGNAGAQGGNNANDVNQAHWNSS
ncbi:hypothetical protein PF005_g7733 [Phytophthora fragariae]|uniref:Uncharacterized protein n=1 Tax=Phytophthora fragariae TaxID=53985 RepID=A0A6A3SUS9_9STRA|nr:hypothetical protein PF003_g7332 [Phytophthora fragariae]KAE8944060.1 hypothetical protein PF009_g6233 [Phytophthora fragariae]KAE9014994.1 hypothetical protein PF011_g7809 [Phytophthora fragariae]KAE9120959.1 hypothetical protein PF007_g7986 [Phytophthora fragariae]KAE9127330.1 hypothetical protein PF010_g4939 [Phytophthora fragariae]